MNRLDFERDYPATVLDCRWFVSVGKILSRDPFFEVLRKVNSIQDEKDSVAFVLKPAGIQIVIDQLDPVAAEIVVKCAGTAANFWDKEQEFIQARDQYEELLNNETVVQADDLAKVFNRANQKYFERTGKSALVLIMQQLLGFANYLETYGIKFVDWDSLVQQNNQEAYVEQINVDH
tara:strand:+ start:94506 stop:95036 length:531 start_codon:yes stop_codon:yes gene_type:complete